MLARISMSVAGGAALAALLATAGPERLVGQEVPTYRSAAAQRDAVTITVYNGNFGLVRELRTVELGRGRVALEFGDVASSIQPETVHIRATGRGDGLRVLEQNYQYDLLSPQKLLEKYVGRAVTLYRWNETTGREEAFQAEVLSVNQGTVFRIGDEITFDFPGRIAFPEVPENLIARPTLVWTLDSQAARPQVEVSYLARELNWKADYVMVVGEDDAAGDLTGWVTLTNGSGATYENATLKLVAGDVQRVQEMEKVARLDAMRAVGEAAAPQFTEEGFFEYHLYTLERPTTLRNNEQKQVTLLESRGFGVEKKLIYYGAAHFYRGQYGEVMSNQKIGVYLDFRNSEQNRLGMPLPAGIVRVYKADRSGAQQFVGEDRIDHTPRDERVRIKMGEAFDVVGERKQMDFDVLGGCVSESAWEIELRNHKDEKVRVEVYEPVGGDWEILSSSHPATKVDAYTFKFEVDVPADGSTKIEYRVRVRWC